jgi:magnesium chelatase subunit I
MQSPTIYPFVAIVRQDEMKLALILNIINPLISGVLIRGDKGTGKSTAVRALAAILPEIDVVENCPFQLPPGSNHAICQVCGPCPDPVRVIRRKVRVIELPVGATEDRVVGSMDLETAIKEGERRFEPGILAAAHRGILYVDEVNLLDDHVVDLLLDAAAMGTNTVEREGISISHPSRFTLVGTMNPEEGELRPQLLDRFGLYVRITGIPDPMARVEVMERRAAFEQDAAAFVQRWEPESHALQAQIQSAIQRHPLVRIERTHTVGIARRCIEAGVDGHRADIITYKAATALAAWRGRNQVADEDVETAISLALPHRLRRLPFDEIDRLP